MTLELSRTLNTMPSIQNNKVRQVPGGRFCQAYRYSPDTLSVNPWYVEVETSKLLDLPYCSSISACCSASPCIKSDYDNVLDPSTIVAAFGHYHGS